jgi:hypothetical protein
MYKKFLFLKEKTASNKYRGKAIMQVMLNRTLNILFLPS